MLTWSARSGGRREAGTRGGSRRTLDAAKRRRPDAGMAEEGAVGEPGTVGEGTGFRVEVFEVVGRATGAAFVHSRCPFLGRGDGEPPWPWATGPLPDGRLETVDGNRHFATSHVGGDGLPRARGGEEA